MALASFFVQPATPHAGRVGFGWSSSLLMNAGDAALLVRRPVAMSYISYSPLLKCRAYLPPGLRQNGGASFVPILVRAPVASSTLETSAKRRPNMTSEGYGVSSTASARAPERGSWMFSFGFTPSGTIRSEERR